MSSSFKAHLLGLAFSLAVPPLTVAGVLGMNSLISAPEVATSREVSFEVEPQAPKPKPKRRQTRKPQRRNRSTQRTAAPPPPSLSAALSGVAFDLPAYELGSLDAVGDEVLGDLDDVVHTEETVDTRPVARSTVPIDVPAQAKAKHLKGRLVLSLLIGADGRVRQARVLEAEPAGVFEEAALRSVQQWVFEPATYQGRSVEVWATLPVEFAP